MVQTEALRTVVHIEQLGVGERLYVTNFETAYYVLDRMDILQLEVSGVKEEELKHWHCF